MESEAESSSVFHVDGTAGMASQAVWHVESPMNSEGPPTPTPADGADGVPSPDSLTPEQLSTLQAIANAAPDSDATPWSDLKPLILTQLSYNIHLYLHRPPPNPKTQNEPLHRGGVMYDTFPPRGPPSPHSTTVRLPVTCDEKEAKEEVQKIKELMDEFDENAPFTLQRLVDLVLNPFLQYRKILKYLRAVTRVLLVTPSFDPTQYAPAVPPASSLQGNSGPATPFQLASTPLFSPIPFLEGKDIPLPPPRRRSPSPPLPREFVQRRMGSLSPVRNVPLSPRGGGRRGGGARIATSSAAMSAQTRRRSTSITSGSPPELTGSAHRGGAPTSPSFHIPPPGRSPPLRSDPLRESASRPLSHPQRRSPSPSPKSPPVGPTPTRVDELDNPDAHKTMLAEPVALSSVTTGKQKVMSPPLSSASLAGMAGLVSRADKAVGLGLGGLGLDLGERFVKASPSVSMEPEPEGIIFPKMREDPQSAQEETIEEKIESGQPASGAAEGVGEGEGEEGEVERIVSEEPEIEGHSRTGDDADDAHKAGGSEEKEAVKTVDVEMSDS